MKKISLFELFISFFKINTITFGGGYAIMPIIKKVYVDDKRILLEEDMLDLIALAQSVPGAMAINTSMLVGYKLRGTLGALVSLIGAFLPPLLIISIVSIFYQIFQTNPLIQAILGGMRGAVSAVMIFCGLQHVQIFTQNKSTVLTDLDVHRLPLGLVHKYFRRLYHAQCRYHWFLILWIH